MPLTLKKLRIIKLSLESCNHELSSHPTNTGYLLIRGLLYNLVRRYESALSDFNTVIKNFPEDYTGYFLRGDTYFRQGNIKAAERDLVHGLKIQLGSEPGMKEISDEKVLELVVLDGEPNKRVGEVLDYEKNVVLTDVLSTVNWSDSLSQAELDLLRKNN